MLHVLVIKRLSAGTSNKLYRLGRLCNHNSVKHGLKRELALFQTSLLVLSCLIQILKVGKLS